MEKAFFFYSAKSSTTEIRESAASFSGGNGWFASSWKFSPPSIFWNYTAWLACRLELLISDTSGFLKCKCRNCWRNLGFCLCAQTSPRGSRSSAAVRQELLFSPLSFQTPITRSYYVPFVLLKCSCVCSLSVKQMGSSWPALVSPDSYIVNQISFSSINDKDLHYYKNLRNLWVLSACLHTHLL